MYIEFKFEIEKVIKKERKYVRKSEDVLYITDKRRSFWDVKRGPIPVNKRPWSLVLQERSTKPIEKRYCNNFEYDEKTKRCAHFLGDIKIGPMIMYEGCANRCNKTEGRGF